jgi:hypothetical protein
VESDFKLFGIREMRAQTRLGMELMGKMISKPVRFPET